MHRIRRSNTKDSAFGCFWIQCSITTRFGVRMFPDLAFECGRNTHDKSANADGQRRRLQKPDNQIMTPVPESSGIAPLLKNLMAQYAATGLPPAYIPTENNDE